MDQSYPSYLTLLITMHTPLDDEVRSLRRIGMKVRRPSQDKYMTGCSMFYIIVKRDPFLYTMKP